MRKVKNRVNKAGEIWCYDCSKYLPAELFYKQSGHWNPRCKECRTIYNRKKYTEKIDTEYPYGYWTVEETEENKLYMSVVLELLGYDSSKNIHEQFMEKHKKYFQIDK